LEVTVRYFVLMSVVTCTLAAAAQDRSAPRPISVRDDPPALGIHWARIPAGTFQMGCVPGDELCQDDEKPRHSVTLSKDYWMMTTEATIQMFRAFSSAGHAMPLQPLWNTDPHQPATNVDFHVAVEFCGWLGGRLPTEAEWERAARGGVDGAVYLWSDAKIPMINGRPAANGADESWARKYPEDEKKYGHIAGYDDGFADTSPVGSFPPNAFGLFDVIGNAFEITAEKYGPFQGTAATDPHEAPSTTITIRGGATGNGLVSLRLSERRGLGMDVLHSDVGIRCAKDVTVARDR
jgi:sulfatase modifying factor 1